MEIQKSIIDIFKSYDQYNFEPVECMQRCVKLLESTYEDKSVFDICDTPQAMEVCNAYGFTANLFLQNNFSSAATSILIDV